MANDGVTMLLTASGSPAYVYVQSTQYSTIFLTAHPPYPDRRIDLHATSITSPFLMRLIPWGGPLYPVQSYLDLHPIADFVRHDYCHLSYRYSWITGSLKGQGTRIYARTGRLDTVYGVTVLLRFANLIHTQPFIYILAYWCNILLTS